MHGNDAPFFNFQFVAATTFAPEDQNGNVQSWCNRTYE